MLDSEDRLRARQSQKCLSEGLPGGAALCVPQMTAASGPRRIGVPARSAHSGPRVFVRTHRVMFLIRNRCYRPGPNSRTGFAPESVEWLWYCARGQILSDYTTFLDEVSG